MVYNVYTDGSYKDFGMPYGPFYASAATITKEGSNSELAVLTKVSNDSDLISMRNVAGELMAVMMVMEHCLNVLHVTQDDTIVLHYDYVGIENWTKRKGEPNYWRAKNYWTQGYRDYINTLVRTRTKLQFVHTPGHKGIIGNERVDELAKEALENHIRKIRKA